MEKDALIKDLEEFLTTEKACLDTLACLNQKAELAIRVAGSIELAVLYDGNRVIAEQKKALAPDFIFEARPDAIAVLIAEKGLSAGQLGVKLVKLLVSRDISVAMPSSVFQITRKGYLKIITVGGMEFLSEMKKHNLASLPKITAALKKLSKKSN